MSDITRDRNEHAVYGGVIVDVVEDSLDRVTDLLDGIEHGVKKAVGSALKRAAQAGRTEAKRPVTQEYAISQSEFLAQTRHYNHFLGDVSVVFGFHGYSIPLMKFNTHVDGSGRVVTNVKRNNTAEVLNHAFTAQVNGHRGVFEREGPDRYPIHELYGPSTPQMMYSNESVMDAIEEKVADTYEKRIDHEILAILNGWR